MDFIHLGQKVSFGTDYECSVKVFLLAFAGNSSDSIHLELSALRFDSFKGGRVGKVLSVVDHVLFGIGRVTNLAEHRDIGSLLACTDKRLFNIVDIGLFIGDTTSL